MRRLPCPFDGDCSAGRLYHCVWRALSRRPHTHATCERRIDAKASSEDAVVDVEVDRCIDENAASEPWVRTPSYLVLLSPKLQRLKLETVSDWSQTSLPRTPYKISSVESKREALFHGYRSYETYSIYINHTKVVLCWAGLVILELIIPVHILKSATRCQERFFTLARCAIM